MSDRVKHKSRDSDRSTSRHKKKTSRKRSTSASDDCVIVIPSRNSCSKDKRRKTKKKKRHRSSSDSRSSEDSIKKFKLVDNSRQLLGERPEFCRNVANEFSQGSSKTVSPDRREGRTRSRERTSNECTQKQFAIFERHVAYSSLNEKQRRKKGTSKDLEKCDFGSKKRRKSQKRRRCSRSSSSSRSSRSTSRSSSSSSSSSTSSDSSYERRKRRKQKKKKLAKKIKREKKKNQDEKQKIKKIKQKFKEPVKEIECSISKTEHDRLLKDINVELADRAKAMAPMTKEQWEKKQSVVRRVYDEETGRHRLIKGDGEVLEEIVSRDRHMEINRNATKGDGEFFQSRIRVNK